MKESKVRLQKTAGFDTISDRLSEGRKRDNGVIRHGETAIQVQGGKTGDKP